MPSFTGSCDFYHFWRIGLEIIRFLELQVMESVRKKVPLTGGPPGPPDRPRPGPARPHRGLWQELGRVTPLKLMAEALASATSPGAVRPQVQRLPGAPLISPRLGDPFVRDPFGIDFGPLWVTLFGFKIAPKSIPNSINKVNISFLIFFQKIA